MFFTWISNSRVIGGKVAVGELVLRRLRQSVGLGDFQPAVGQRPPEHDAVLPRTRPLPSSRCEAARRATRSPTGLPPSRRRSDRWSSNLLERGEHRQGAILLRIQSVGLGIARRQIARISLLRADDLQGPPAEHGGKLHSLCPRERRSTRPTDSALSSATPFAGPRRWRPAGRPRR